MNPDCLSPLLEHGDLLTWVGAAAAAGAAWLGLFAVSKYLGKQETPRLAFREDEEVVVFRPTAERRYNVRGGFPRAPDYEVAPYAWGEHAERG